jgi:hypothetical protein
MSTHLTLLQGRQLRGKGLTALPPVDRLRAAAACSRALSAAKVQLTHICLVLLQHLLQQTAAAIGGAGGTQGGVWLLLLLCCEELPDLWEAESEGGEDNGSAQATPQAVCGPE